RSSLRSAYKINLSAKDGLFILVGALDVRHKYIQLASYSNRVPMTHPELGDFFVCAPGDCFSINTFLKGSDPGFFIRAQSEYTGTSISTAIATGFAARIMNEYPSFTPREVGELILLGASKMIIRKGVMTTLDASF